MYLAIDVGGTKTLLALFSPSGRMIESKRFETPQNYDDFLTTLTDNYQILQHDTHKVDMCAVGAPGRIDRNAGKVLALGNRDWINAPLARDIEKICDAPVRLENDANLAGLSEGKLISRGHKKILYVTVSTGIGGSIIKDGVIDHDYADMEIGHMVFEHDGKIQLWEEFASGRAIVNKYGKKASELDDPSAWYEISRNLALGLTNACAALTPDVIIFGGGVGTHFHKFADLVHEAMTLYSSRMVTVPALRQAIRAEEAVIYGCYELAAQKG